MITFVDVAVQVFFTDHPDVARLEWDGHEVSVWHDGPNATPCSYSEFKAGTDIRYDLMELEDGLEALEVEPMAWTAKPFERVERQLIVH